MTITELLTAADPLHDETEMPRDRRDAIRRSVVRAASDGARDSGLSRRVVVLAWGTAALCLALTASLVWMGDDATLHAAMQFEVRLAGADAGGGMRGPVSVESGRTIYVDQEIVLTNEDVAETRVVVLPDGFGVEVDLTEAGAGRMRAATTEHVGSLLAIIVDGELLAAPVIRSPIDQIGVITGDFTRDEAERLAEGIRRP